MMLHNSIVFLLVGFLLYSLTVLAYLYYPRLPNYLTIQLSSARLSSSTFTRGSPRKPNWRPWVFLSTSAFTDILGQSSRQRNAMDLIVRRRHADMRVKSAARSGHQVDRDRLRCWWGRPP